MEELYIHQLYLALLRARKRNKPLYLKIDSSIMIPDYLGLVRLYKRSNRSLILTDLLFRNQMVVSVWVHDDQNAFDWQEIRNDRELRAAKETIATWRAEYCGVHPDLFESQAGMDSINWGTFS